MPTWSPALSLTDTDSTSSSELENLLKKLDIEKLDETIDTLETCASIENDPDVVETEMQSLDFELLAETADHLEDTLQYVHDPVLRTKSQFVDNMEVASKNLSLIADPMLERREPDDALTFDQATRFVLETYSPNELIRQRAAIQSAYRSLTRIRESIDSNKALLESEGESGGLLDRLRDLVSGILDRRPSGPSPGSSGGQRADESDDTSRESGGSGVEAGPELPPLDDISEDEIVWDQDDTTPNPKTWVDDRHSDE